MVPDLAAADTPESKVWLQDGLLDSFRYKVRLCYPLIFIVNSYSCNC